VVADVDLTEEVVYTSRRASLRQARRWTPGRLRVSDRALRFTAHDGAVVELTGLLDVRVVRWPRRALVLGTSAGPVRLRCFAMPAVAALLRP
jgi:hypothetical protein